MVDTSGAARTLLVEVVRGLGFSDVSGVPGIKEAISMLEVEPINWIITPLMADQSENGMQLLKLFCSHPILNHLRISFLVEENEQDILPDAFEKGLLSFHHKPFTKDSLTSEFNEFLKKFDSYNWNATLMSAAYLRNVMIEQKRYEEQLIFEKKILDMYPGHIDLMFNLIPPLANLSREDEALAVLKQINLIDKSQEEKIEKYLSEYFEGKSINDAEGDEINFLGIKKVLIVDSDDAVIKEVTSVLNEMGVNEIVACNDGEAGVSAVKSNEDLDLIIQEWRLPKLAGPLFLQKAQEEISKTIPFVLISSLIEEQDTPFVKEMGVANIIKKPLKREEFAKAIIWTIQQDKMPTEQSAMERKMRQFLSERKMKEAEEIKERFIQDTTIKLGAKEVIEAEFAYENKDYSKARDFGIEAIKHAGDSIFILNLLGKTMMNLREFDIALRCFEKAQSIAPMNIERLCQIAEVHSEMGNNEKAESTIDEASVLDPDSERVKETSAKIALNDNDTPKAKKIMSQLKAMENVVSYMNNQAVAMARCGMIDEGIKQYQKTLESIPDSRPDIIAIVNYNLALGYIRGNNTKSALEPLEQAVIAASSVQERAQNLLKKLRFAIKKGKPLVMQKPSSALPDAQKKESDESSSTAASSEQSEVLDASKSTVLTLMKSKAGDMACHLIFQTSQASAKAEKLLQGELRFNPREAILKEATGGADKLLASGI